jgi:hypothetical protein
MRVRLMLALILIALLSALAGAGPPAQAAPVAPPAAASPAPAQACPASPFGSSLILGRESEIFVGYRGSSGRLQHDRLDQSDTGQLERRAAWPTGAAPETALESVAEVATTTLDTNADGRAELAQAFSDANAAYRVVLQSGNNGSTSYWTHTDSNHSGFAIAAGNLTRSTTDREQIVIVSRTSLGTLNVLIPPSRLGQLDQGSPPQALWRSNQEGRGNAEQLGVATGDLDGDGFDDEIAVVIKDNLGRTQVLVLEYDASYGPVGSGSNYANKLRLIDYIVLSSGTPLEVRIAIGDVDARFRDDATPETTNYREEIIVATNDFSPATPGLSAQLDVTVLGLKVTAANEGKIASALIEQRGQWTHDAAHSRLALAAADTDYDGRAEPIVAYRGFNPERLEVWTLNAELNTITAQNSWANSSDARTSIEDLAVAASDLDRDGGSDIVAAFRDADSQLQVLHLTDVVTPSQSLSLRSFVRDGTGGRNGATAIGVSLADWDGDSLKAEYAPAYNQIDCKVTVDEPNLDSLIYAPPYWQRLQVDRWRQASLGKSRHASDSQERYVTTSHGHSVSAYFGAGFEAKMPLTGSPSVSSELRFTAGAEYLQSQTTGGGSESSITFTQGYSSGGTGSLVVTQEVTSDCYTYKLRQGAELLDGEARFCETKSSQERPLAPDNWDEDYGPARNPGHQWVPLGRDWANLALFREAYAVQSSVSGELGPARAADGDTGFRPARAPGSRDTGGRVADGSVMSTLPEQQPWWQIDLGRTQDLTSVRVWHRDNYDCGATLCAATLGAFHIFVSDTDFRSIGTSVEALKADARVRSYFFPAVSGPVSSAQTMRDVGGRLVAERGRYVRVQLAGSGTLTLAEVQVFGPNHVEPDRYPVSVSDSTPNDGVFEVGVYGPDGRIRQVKMRGNLIWNGPALLSARSFSVSRNDNNIEWSIYKENLTSSVRAEAVEINTSVGVSLDVAVEAGTKVTAGGGYEFSAGVLNESVRSISWGTGLEFGGEIAGLPSELDGRPLTRDNLRPCEYSFQPFQYELVDSSNSGYRHRFTVVDYVVPQLQRQADRSLCKQALSATPLIESNLATGAPGSLFVLNATGFPADANATLSLQGPGDSEFRPLSTLTMSANGERTIVLATRPEDPPGSYRLRLTVGAAITAETSLSLATGAPLLDERPDGSVLTVGTDERLRLRVYLPLTLR